jgi:hypothetical protein
MKTKLTLRVEKRLIEKAKKHAKSRNTSVSQMVADYFKAIENQKKKDDSLDYSPITASLIGVLKGSTRKEEDYKSYLEEKYLE